MQDILNSFETLGTETYTPETLRGIAREGAMTFLQDNEKSLSDILAALLSKNPGLNQDQVHRIVEQANVDVFTQKFKTEEDKNVQFDPASSKVLWDGIIADRLDPIVREDKLKEDSFAYSTPPEDYKASFSPSLEEIFKHEGNGDLLPAEPGRKEILEASSVKESLGNEQAKTASLQYKVAHIAEDFGEEATRAFLDGSTSLGELSVICKYASPNNIVARELSGLMLDQIIEKTGSSVKKLKESLHVLRFRTPNPEHALVKSAAAAASYMEALAVQTDILAATENKHNEIMQQIGLDYGK